MVKAATHKEPNSQQMSHKYGQMLNERQRSSYLPFPLAFCPFMPFPFPPMTQQPTHAFVQDRADYEASSATFSQNFNLTAAF